MDKIGDVSKLKVADLKRHLKNRDLAITGNKTELVDRLEKALSGGGEGNAGMDEEEFDEEEILGGDDEDTTISQEEEAAALAGTVRVKETVTLTRKKISLKRSEPTLSSQADNGTTEVESPTKEVKEKESSDGNAEPKQKVIKLAEVTETSAAEERSKRFGITAPTLVATADDTKKVTRAERFGITATETPAATNGTPKANKRAPKLSMETGGTDLVKLKKRADRFGEVTAKTLTKVQSLEKLKDRKERFTSTESSKTEETATPAAPAAADSTTEATSNKTPITAPGDTKKKRAERFAVTV